MILSELDYILRHIISRGIQAVDRFNKTFETYWNDEEFRIFEPTDEDNKRELKESLSAKVREESLYVFFDLKPYSHQKEILWDLMVEREEYDSSKNLVVAATGTGKTGVMAVASQITKDVVLIIVPNSILPEQTLSEIQEGFFNKINHKPSRIKEAIIIDKASMMSKLDYEKNPILIMTIQLLAYIAENEEVYWKSLKDNVKLLFLMKDIVSPLNIGVR